jgi:hypothetical protein
MTMQFKCDSCGQVVEVPQTGAEGAECIGPDTPPAGWRSISTMIEEHAGNGRLDRTLSEILHSCADCNVHMSVAEHLSAEFLYRKANMGGGIVPPPAPPPRVEPPSPAPDSPPDGVDIGVGTLVRPSVETEAVVTALVVPLCDKGGFCSLEKGHGGECYTDDIPF